MYQYDSLNQLTDVWYGADATDPDAISSYDALHTYTLDPLGNRLTVETNAQSTAYQPNSNGKLTNPMHRYEQVDGQSFDYDETGNLLTDGSHTYTYDILNRQISLNALDTDARLQYTQ